MSVFRHLVLGIMRPVPLSHQIFLSFRKSGSGGGDLLGKSFGTLQKNVHGIISLLQQFVLPGFLAAQSFENILVFLYNLLQGFDKCI